MATKCFCIFRHCIKVYLSLNTYKITFTIIVVVAGACANGCRIAGQWLANGWPMVGQRLANGWPTVGQWLANGWPIVGQWLASGWSMVDQRLANGWSMVEQWLANGWPMAADMSNGWPMVGEWLANVLESMLRVSTHQFHQIAPIATYRRQQRERACSHEVLHKLAKHWYNTTNKKAK